MIINVNGKVEIHHANISSFCLLYSCSICEPGIKLAKLTQAMNAKPLLTTLYAGGDVKMITRKNEQSDMIEVL